MRRERVFYFLWVILLLSSATIYSQGPPPPPPGVPVDGGIALLLIFGVFYGVFCILKR